MSIQPPQGILNIPNATLRVGKLAVDSTAGFDTVFNNVERNTILLEDSTEYTETKQWDLKMPNIFVATFEIKGGGSSFNFRNTSNGDATKGYTLTFSGTTLTLKYGEISSEVVHELTTATIPTLDSNYGKVYLTYEKQHFTVTVDGTLVLTYKDTTTRTPPEGEYANFFAGAGSPGFKNLKVVAGHFISDGTSNIAYVGGGEVAVGKALAFNRVSNVSQIKVDSSVVAEYTGPHDRPLRKYPEVALTADDNLSTSGYKASVSSLLTGNDAFNTFDVTGATSYWHSQYPYYTHVTGTYNPGQSALGTGTPANGTTLPTTELISGHQGEWIKLQMPKKIKLEEVRVYASSRAASSIYQMPKDIAIAGSNDGTNWYLVDSGTLRTGIRESYGMASLLVTTSSYYSHLALIVKTIDNQGANYSAIEIANIEYYGREEGSGSIDTTLKSVYNVPATTGTQLEVYYDGRETSSYSGSGTTVTDLALPANNGTLDGVGFDSTYKAFTFDGDNDKIDTALTGFSDTGTYTVSLWIKSASIGNSVAPEEIVYQFGHGTQGEGFGVAIKSGNIGTYIFSGQARRTTGTKCVANEWFHATFIYTSNGSMDIYINGVLDNGTLSGTLQELTIPTNPFLTLGVHFGGEQASFYTAFFNGSIANFRLYSKVLSADQIKELYDYQKDYFLGSKSQVTLYKGHLGVGVTEPSGQLELAGDERIQEYPPRGMTGYETLVEGHGVFKVYSTGGLYNNGSGGNLPWTVFNKITGTFNDGTSWVSEDAAAAGAGGNYNNDGSSGYGGSHRLSSNTPLGDYLVICLPYSIVLKSYSLSNLSGGTGYGAADFPRDYIIYGSNDDVNWEVVDSRSDQEAGGLAPAAHVSAGYLGYTNNYTVSENNKVYSKFAIVITDLNAKQWYDYTSGTYNASYAGISEWRLFGTPGPTTLDKGSLTLGRSLDVPRVSRYDVDTETPRPEKLVVDFDTTVNSSPTDISGKGNHGTMVGATYSPADKAFNFDGTDDLIRATVQVTPDFAHSVSVWIKVDTVGENTFFSLGNETTVGTDLTLKSSTVYTTGSGFTFTFYGGDMTIPFSYSTDRWYHIVATRDTGGTFPNTQKFYIDGVDYSASASWNNSTSTTLALPTTATLLIGKILWATSARFDGQISNFKIYNAVLEPSEVQKLYRLGRTGRSMVISDTAVGIGKVPEAQLDVRGIGKFETCHIRATDIDISATHGIVDISQGARTAGSQNPPSHTPPLYITGNIGSASEGVEFRHFNQSQGIGFGYNTIYATGHASGGDQDLSLKAYGSGVVRLDGGDAITSDDRLKTNEEYLTNATETLLKLKPQLYDKHKKINETCENPMREAGLITQDVYYDAPELRFLVHARNKGMDAIIPVNIPEEKPFVDDDPTKDPDYSGWGTDAASLNYGGLIPYLIKSNQEIYNELQAEKAHVSDLLERVTALENA